MIDSQQAAAAARWLLAERGAGRTFRRLPDELAPADPEQAYAVQRCLLGLLAVDHGPPAGGKIALTTPVMQTLVNYHQPVAGGVLRDQIFRNRVELPSQAFVRPCVECEVAVELARPLGRDTTPHSAASVADAVAACMAAIELVDDRAADYSALDAMTLIADNALNRGCVLASPVAGWRALDLPSAQGSIRINGHEVGRGRGADVMGGHPFAALAWLADHAAANGETLPAGSIVLTGSLVATQFPERGQEVIIAIEGLGEASVRFT